MQHATTEDMQQHATCKTQHATSKRKATLTEMGAPSDMNNTDAEGEGDDEPRPRTTIEPTGGANASMTETVERRMAREARKSVLTLNAMVVESLCRVSGVCCLLDVINMTRNMTQWPARYKIHGNISL